MSLVERDQIIQTLAPDRADQAFAECVRFRSPNWCFQDSNAEAFKLFVQRRREDGIPVVNHKTIGMMNARNSRNCWIVHSAVGCSVILLARNSGQHQGSTTSVCGVPATLPRDLAEPKHNDLDPA